jgi:hypothetical protein
MDKLHDNELNRKDTLDFSTPSECSTAYKIALLNQRKIVLLRVVATSQQVVKRITDTPLGWVLIWPIAQQLARLTGYPTEIFARRTPARKPGSRRVATQNQF